LDGRRIASPGLRTGTAAIAAGLLMAAVADAVRPAGPVERSVHVGAAAVIGALEYVGACRLLRVEELRVAFQLLRSPPSRSARAARCRWFVSGAFVRGIVSTALL